MRPQILLVEDLLFLVSFMKPVMDDLYDVIVANNAESARTALTNHQFQLALLDLNLGEPTSGLDLLPEIINKDIPVIVISAHCTPAMGLACLRNKISCFIDKHKMGSDLMEKIALVLAGKKDFPAEWLARLGDGATAKLPTINLTQRKVLSLLVRDQDLSNLEISSILGIKEDTVKKAVSELMHRFNAKHRFDLIRRARERGFLPVMVPDLETQTA